MSAERPREAASASPERTPGPVLRLREHGVDAPQPAPPVRSATLPLALGLAAIVVWLGFQTWQVETDRQALQAALVGQQQTVENASKLRATLDALAADTQRLADAGNPNARLLVDELKKRGITINAGAAVAPAAKP